MTRRFRANGPAKPYSPKALTVSICATPEGPHSSTTRFLYVGTSEQMPGVVKAGQTGRSPLVRAKELSDVTNQVLWDILAIFPVQDSLFAEKLLQGYLDAECERYLSRKELWCTTAQRVQQLARQAVERTPKKILAPRPWAAPHSVTARTHTTLWHLALAMPVRCKPLRPAPLTLGELIGFVSHAQTRQPAEQALRRLGFVLTCLDPKAPRFHILLDEDSSLSRWIASMELCWAQFGGQLGKQLVQTFDICACEGEGPTAEA